MFTIFIAIDIDGVVASIIPHLLKAIKERYGISVDPRTLTTYNVHDCTPLTLSEIMAIFSDKKTAREFYRTMPVMRNAKCVIAKLKQKHTVIFATARNFYPKIYDDTSDWLASNGLLRGTGVIFCPDKVQVAKNHDINLFIEDRGETAVELAEAGIPTFLFNAIYNQDFNHHLISRMKNWKEIERCIMTTC